MVPLRTIVRRNQHIAVHVVDRHRMQPGCRLSALNDHAAAGRGFEDDAQPIRFIDGPATFPLRQLFELLRRRAFNNRLRFVVGSRMRRKKVRRRKK